MSKFEVSAFSETSCIGQNVLQKFTEPIWWSHQVRLCAPLTWQLESSVTFWNLLWLSRRLIIWTKPTNIYASTFPNTLSPKRLKITRWVHSFPQTWLEWYVMHHDHNSELQTTLDSKLSTLLSLKVVNRYNKLI